MMFVMTLKETLKIDLTAAMRAGDELRRSTLRLALAAIMNEEVAGKVARELSDAEVLAVLNREAKKRRESATAYEAGNRQDLVDRELAELGVLEFYLPAALDPVELERIVVAAVAEVGDMGVSGPRAMGSVMKIVTPQVVGRADGSAVAAMVKARLAE
jgi:uncharacterized protein YqeY